MIHRIAYSRVCSMVCSIVYSMPYSILYSIISYTIDQIPDIIYSISYIQYTIEHNTVLCYITLYHVIVYGKWATNPRTMYLHMSMLLMFVFDD